MSRKGRIRNQKVKKIPADIIQTTSSGKAAPPTRREKNTITTKKYTKGPKVFSILSSTEALEMRDRTQVKYGMDTIQSGNSTRLFEIGEIESSHPRTIL